MSKLNQFHEEVVGNEGWILSYDTLQIDTLLAKSYDLLVGLEENEKLQKEILEVFVLDDDNFEESHTSLNHDRFYGLAHVHEQKMDDAHYIWNEDIYNYFNEISPNGYYFGSNVGDGACIGWFKFEEEGEF